MALALDLNLFNNDLIISSVENFAEIFNFLFNHQEAYFTDKLDNTAKLMVANLNIDEVMSNVTSWVTNAGNMEYEATQQDVSNVNDIILCYHY